MKKRFISKWLMATLVVVTMGVFSSCKDYDDDINANTALINQLQTQVDALKTAAAKAQADATQALTNAATAQAAADKAAADLATAKTDLQNAINAAKSNLEGQIDAAKQAAITEAQARVDAAEARAKAYAQEVAQNEAAAAASAAKAEILAKLENDVNTLNTAINANKQGIADNAAAIAVNANNIAANKAAADAKFSEIDALLATLATKEEVNNALQPIMGDIAALNALVATKADQTTVEAIDARLTQLYNTLVNDYVLKSDFQALQAAVALLGSRMDAAEGNINQLTASVATNTADIATNAGNIATNAGNIATNAENISVNALAITALQQTVNQILENYATIAYVDSKITALDDKLSAEIAKMALKSELEALEVVVNNAIAQHNSDKADLDAKDAALQEAIDAINATIPTLATKTELQEAVDGINTALANLGQALQALKESVYTKTETDAAISSAVAAAKTELEIQLNAAKLELQGEISNLSSHVDDVENALRALIEARLAELNAELTTLITGIETTLSGKIGEVDGKVNDLTTDVNTKYTSIMGIIASLATTAYVDGKVTEVTSYVDGKVIDLTSYVDGKITDVNTAISNLTTTMQNVYATINTVNGLSDRVDVLTGRVDGIENELNGMAAALNALAEELGALELDEIAEARMGANVTGGINALVNLLRTMSTKINEVYDYLDALGVQISDMETAFDSKINGVYAFFNEAIAGVNTRINNITLFIDHNLTSIVFRPSNVDGDDAWLYGFPKIDADIIAAQSTYTFTHSGANATYTETAKASQEQSGYAFELTAQYWLNPSTTDWKNYTYSFDEIATKNQITRSNRDYNEAGFKEVRAEKYENGVLTIKFKFDKGENVNDAYTVSQLSYLTNGKDEDQDGYSDVHWLSDQTVMDGNAAYSFYPSYAWVTTVALQATRNNTETDAAAGLTNNRVVTSDYAIIAPTYINNLLLGNNAYASKGHGLEGNQLYHLRTVFNDVKAEDALGSYSFELYLDDVNGIELNKYVDVHYNNCAVWTNAVAQKKGFEFKYTLLVNDDVWSLDGDKITIKDGKGVSANTGNDKAAIIRVELIANGKTYAYGYISVLMKNKESKLDVNIPKLVLKCVPTQDGFEDFKATYSWNELIKAINEKLGKNIDWNLANFVVLAAEDKVGVPFDGPYKKFKNTNSNDADNDTKGTLKHEGANLVWSFTEAEATAAFYKADGETPADVKNYKVLIKIAPNADGVTQGVAPMWITITIGEVVYPEASFGFDQRILKYWFTEQGDENSDDPAGRYEVHGSVEVKGQLNANDEFDYDFSATFRRNTFVATAAEGFDYSNNHISAFFDATKYYVLPAAGLAANAQITDAMLGDKKATTIATGATGARYLLYLKSADDNTLRAIKEIGGKFNYKNSQAVVVLGGVDAAKNISNFIASFQKYTYFDGTNAADYEYAYDLLNAADHKVLKGDATSQKITFTTHMILKITDYCLPIKYTNKGNQFDIRYLRPISIDNLGDYTVYDAVDGAYDENGNLIYNSKTMIYLADIVKFIDWRDIKFIISDNPQEPNVGGMDYVNYYGIKAIHPNFDEALCDLDGKFELINEVTDKLKFSDETIGISPLRPGRTAQEFKDEIGYFLYENNSSVVETFHIKLPITIEYHWGVTAPETITITVIRTQANARQN